MLKELMNPFKWPIYVQTLASMVVGIIVGYALGPRAADAGVIAKYIIDIIKTTAIPLLFFAILDAFFAVNKILFLISLRNQNQANNCINAEATTIKYIG